MSLRQRLGRIGRWPRLAAASACLVLSAVTALDGAADPPQDRSAPVVVVAARSLPAGHSLTSRDLTTVRSRPVGPGTLRRPARLLGRRLAGPVARGEPVTSLRLLDAGLTTGLPAGAVALPVDVTTDVHGLVSPGGRIDLLAVSTADAVDTGARAGPAQRVAERVLVLAVLPSDSATGAGGCRLVLALDRDAALRVAGARATRLFQVAALPP